MSFVIPDTCHWRLFPVSKNEHTVTGLLFLYAFRTAFAYILEKFECLHI